MAKSITEWHGVGREVYHNNTACTEGNNIEIENIRKGKGGLRLCKRCAALNKK